MKKINTILRWTLLSGLFFVPFIPLIIANGALLGWFFDKSGMFFPYITGKNFMFRIIVEIIAGAWIVLAVTDSYYRPKKSWIFWSFIIFFGVITIADIFSLNTFKSFWSNYERMEGWMTIAHLFMYFVVVATVFGRESWDKFFQTWLGASVAATVYSFFQIFGLITSQSRTDGTFGNATYLAIYCLFNIFLILFFVIRARGQFKSRFHAYLFLGFNVGFLIFIAPTMGSSVMNAALTGRLIGMSILTFIFTNALFIVSAMYEDGRILYCLIAITQVVVLYETQTRGSLLGFIGGLVVAGALLAWLEKENKILKRTGLGIVIVAVIVVLGFFAIRNSSFANKPGSTLARFASISLTDTTTQSRFILWNSAWQGFKENPKTVLIGWGQESFNYVFNTYYDPRMYKDEQWFDRTHDIFFDWLIDGGILGLASYFLLFGSIVWYIWDKKGENHFSVAEKSILTGMLAGYLIHNLFVFDNIGSYIFYVSIAAYVYSRRTMWGSDRTHTYKENRFILPVMFVVVCAVVYFVNVPALAENVDLIKAISPQTSADSTIAAFNLALSYHSFGDPETREQIMSVADQIISQIQSAEQQQGQAPQTYIDAENKFMALVSQQSQIQIAKTPLDARYYLLPGSVYNHAGSYDQAVLLLQKALSLSPKKQSIMYELASAYLSQGNPSASEALLKTAYTEDTENQTARLLYAAAAVYNKDTAVANQVLAGMSLQDVAASDQLIQAYYAVKNYPELVILWTERVKDNPTNVQNYLSLAAGYLLEKDSYDAILQIQKAMVQDPTFKTQGQGYIDDIRAGRIQ